MSKQKPICPECGSGLVPHSLNDYQAECPDCEYYWSWPEANRGKYE